MRKTIKKVILFSLLLSVIFLGLFPSKTLSQSTDDIDFTFFNDNIKSSNLTSFQQEYNVRDKSIYTGVYNATFSFTNEVVGTSRTDISWIDDVDGNDGNRLATIITLNSGHQKIIQMTSDGNAGAFFNIQNNGLTQILGTVEFWWKYIDNGEGNFEFRIFESSTRLVQINFVSLVNKFVYTFGDGVGGTTSQNINAFTDTWYHIKIEFNCTSDKQSLWFNDILLIDNENFRNDFDASIISEIHFQLSGGGGLNSLLGYIDAIGYSWSNPREIDDFSSIPDFNPLSFDPNWNVIIKTGSTATDIIPTKDQRTKVLQLIDNSNDADALVNASRSFPSLPFQDITFDLTKNNITVSGQFFFRLVSRNVVIVDLLFFFDDLQYHNGVGFQALDTNVIIPNRFSTFSVILHSNTFDVFINNTLVGSNLDMKNDPSGFEIDRIRLITGASTDLPFDIFIDNILFNSFYRIGSNLIPYRIRTSIKQNDVFKFDFIPNSITTFKAIDSQEYSSWSVIGTASSFSIQAFDPIQSNRAVRIIANNSVQSQFRKNFVITTGNIINISLDINHLAWDLNERIQLQVISAGFLPVITIDFKNTSTNPNNGSIFSNNLGTIITSGLSNNITYNLNLYINYNDNLSILRLSNSTDLIDTFFLDIMESGQEGLFAIIFVIPSTATTDRLHTLFLDNIGVYVNSFSYSNEFSYVDVNFGVFQWLPFQQNLITLDVISKNITFTRIINVGGGNFTSITIIPSQEYDSITTKNLFDFAIISNPIFRINYLNENFLNETILNSFSIDGIIITTTLDATILRPSYLQSGGNDIDNYFFVDSANVLRFTFTMESVLADLLAIQIGNLVSINSTNRFISFNSNFQEFGIATFQIDYTDATSDIITIPSINTITNEFLTINKFTSTILFTITLRDFGFGDVGRITKTATGSLSNLSLGFGITIISITIVSLFAIIVPLLIILLPTLGIGQRLGKGMIIPLFIIMSIICGITGIIPIWLLFIILIASSLFMFKAKEVFD